MTTKNPETRDRIVQAALQILMQDGELLSMDAVARCVGISKGGVIHHFRTRDALVEAVVERLISELCSLAGAADPGGGDEPSNLARYIDSSLTPESRAAAVRIARGLIRLYGSDARHEAPFLDPWRKVVSDRLDRYRHAGDLQGFARVASVVLAVESFLLMDVFKLYEFTDGEIQAIRLELLSRVGP